MWNRGEGKEDHLSGDGCTVFKCDFAEEGTVGKARRCKIWLYEIMTPNRS